MHTVLQFVRNNRVLFRCVSCSFNKSVVTYFRDEKALYVDLCVLVMKAKTSEAQVHEFSFHRFCVWIPGLEISVFFCFFPERIICLHIAR